MANFVFWKKKEQLFSLPIFFPTRLILIRLIP